MESTHSVVFFGTPHQGSSLASLGTILQNIGTVLSNQQQSPLLETLKANCPKLEDLRDDFRHLAVRYTIVSCFEQRATWPLNCLVSWISKRRQVNELRRYFPTSFMSYTQARYCKNAATIYLCLILTYCLFTC
jgi:hypothetical protein